MIANQVLGVASLGFRRPRTVPLLLDHLVRRAGHAAARGREGVAPLLDRVRPARRPSDTVPQSVRAPAASDHVPPDHVTIVATDICNLKCRMCQYAFSEDPGYQLNRLGHMPTRLFRKLMHEVPGRPLVSFTGGEPLVHPDIAEMIAYASRLNRFTTMVTNGWFLERRAAEIAAAGLNFLTVSIDGPPDAHDRIRGRRSFERLAAGVEAMLAQPRRPITFLTTAISDANHDRLVEVYEYARAWGVDGINFNHLWMQTPAMVAAHNAECALFAADEVDWDVDPSRIDTEVILEQLAEIRRAAGLGRPTVKTTPGLDRQETVFWYREPERFVKYRSARCVWVHLKVWPDGSVKPCRGYVAGNVAEEHAMSVWHGDRFVAFRRHLSERSLLPICARCCYMNYR